MSGLDKDTNSNSDKSQEIEKSTTLSPRSDKVDDYYQFNRSYSLYMRKIESKDDLNYSNYNEYYHTNNSKGYYYDSSQCTSKYNSYKLPKYTSKQDYDSQLKLINTIDSTEKLFETLTLIKSPKNLPLNTAILIFRTDSYPSWETNPKGGMLSITVDIAYIDKYWEIFMFTFVTQYENFELENDLVGGIVKTSIPGKFEFQFWLKYMSLRNQEVLEEKLRKIFRMENDIRYDFYAKEFYKKRNTRPIY